MKMEISEVNPARAGMIRGHRQQGERQGRKPRASGDDPTPIIVTTSLTM